MELFIFVILYYYYCGVFLTCRYIYSAFWLFLFQMSKITKNTINYNSQDTIIANKQQSQPSTNPPRSFIFVHSLSLFLLSITFLPFFSSFSALIWFCDAIDTIINWWVHIRLQSPENRIFLAIRASNCDHPQRLTSFVDIFHLSPDCYPSLLCCVDFLIKCYCCLFYTQSIRNLLAYICYSPSWTPHQITVSILLITPHHCCGIFNNPVLAIEDNQHHSNYHINWN